MGQGILGAFKWEWNVNTVVVLIGFAGGIATAGMFYQKLNDTVSRSNDNTQMIRQLQEENRRLDRVEFRVDVIERNAEGAAASAQRTEQLVIDLASDVRSALEAINRLEDRQGTVRERFPAR